MNQTYTIPKHLQIETVDLPHKHVVVYGEKEIVSHLEIRLHTRLGIPENSYSSTSREQSQALKIIGGESYTSLQLMKMDIVQVLEKYGFQMTSICYDAPRQTEKIIMMKPANTSPTLVSATEMLR